MTFNSKHPPVQFCQPFVVCTDTDWTRCEWFLGETQWFRNFSKYMNCKVGTCRLKRVRTYWRQSMSLSTCEETLHHIFKTSTTSLVHSLSKSSFERYVASTMDKMKV
eukprot:PhF_6_TR5183/c0_g1_i1/m.7449